MCSAFCRPRNARRRMRRSEARTNFDSRGMSATDPTVMARGWLLPARPWTGLPARQIAPQAARMVAHVVIGLDLLAPVKARPRAEQAPSREEVGQRATVIPFAQTFEAPHVRFQERHNSATAIARKKPICARQTRNLRGRASSFCGRGSEPPRRATPPASHPAALPPPRAVLGPRPGPSGFARASRACGRTRSVPTPPSCRRPRGPALWPANARAPYR
jgi:hypothetical protein